MFIRLIIVFASLALSFLGTGEARAQENSPPGLRFCTERISGPADLIQRTRESLSAESSGNRALRGCRATPNHFLASYRARLPEIRRIAPDVRLESVQDLLAFYGRFVDLGVDRDTEYRTDCLHERENGLVVQVGCLERHTHPGETRYGLRTQAGEIGLLMQDCVNPGATPVEIVVTGNPCIEVHFPSMGTRTPIRFAYIGRAPLPGRCHQLTMAGAAPVDIYPRECPDNEDRVLGDGRRVRVNCVWDAVEQRASELLGFSATVQNVFGSFYTRADGTNVLRLPPEALDGLVAICWELPDGSLEWATVGVRRDHYQNRVATITPADVRRSAAAY